MNSQNSEKFVNSYLNSGKQFSSFVLCNECELVENEGKNLLKLANEYAIE